MLSSGASGTLAFAPTILSCTALILSIFANSRCNLVKPDAFVWDDSPNAPESVGLWCFEANNGINYDGRDVEGDSKFEAARGLGTTTMVFGWLIFFFYLFAACFPFGPVVFRITGLLGILTCLFQGLVFLVYKSNICAAGCSLDTGGRCGIAAVVFWWLAGMTSLAAGKGVEEEPNQAREGVTAGDEEQDKQAAGKGVEEEPTEAHDEAHDEAAAGDGDAAARDVEENK
jgi:hypothetical protein